MSDTPTSHEPQEIRPPFEGAGQTTDKEIGFRTLVFIGVGLAGTAAVCAVIVYFVYFHFVHAHQRAQPAPPVLEEARTQVAPSGPRLMPTPEPGTTAPPGATAAEIAAAKKPGPVPTQELAIVQAEVHKELSTYGWVDRGGGIVHIPIERAITLMAQKGLPEAPKTGGVVIDAPQNHVTGEDDSGYLPRLATLEAPSTKPAQVAQPQEP